MTQGEPFVEKGIEQYEQDLKELQLNHLQKMALKHNLQLVEIKCVYRIVALSLELARAAVTPTLLN